MKTANEWTTQLLVQLSKILLSRTTSTYYGTVHSDAPTCAYTYPLSSYHLLEINIDEWPRSQQERMIKENHHRPKRQVFTMSTKIIDARQLI
jgi:hypothetical protein